MEFKKSESIEEKRKRWYELEHVSSMGVRFHPSDFPDRSITEEDLKGMWMNSYGQDAMFSKYTDDVLIDKARVYMSNCSPPRYPCSTYDEALIHKVVPELIQRLEDANREIENLKSFYDYFAELYGRGLEIANWHMNNELEPFDNFFDTAEEEMESK